MTSQAPGWTSKECELRVGKWDQDAVGGASRIERGVTQDFRAKASKEGSTQRNPWASRWVTNKAKTPPRQSGVNVCTKRKQA